MAISTRCGDAAVIVVDTSAWVEFLRDTGSPTCVRVKELLGADLATCDAIRMEVLAGARNERHRRDLGRLIARAALVPMRPDDFDQAAALYRQCRRRGETVRVLMDCLIAAVHPRRPAASALRCRLRCPRTTHAATPRYDMTVRFPATRDAPRSAGERRWARGFTRRFEAPPRGRWTPIANSAPRRELRNGDPTRFFD